jgi:RNA polymerase sigma-70 factor (ECF subfamily)
MLDLLRDPRPEGSIPVPTPDPDAVLTAAYLEHREPVRRWLVARTHDPDIAEELLHEAFMRLMRELRRGTDVENPRAWLFHAASNLLVSHARHAQVVSRHTPHEPSFEAASAEAVVLTQERMDHLQRALAELSPADRDLLLAAGMGGEGPELAAAAGISDVALRTRLCRARKRLREQVAGDRTSCLAAHAGLPA